VTAFGRKAKWLLEDRLREAGVEYSKATLPLRPYTVRDRTPTPARTRSPRGDWSIS
jgi:hypothetical protein